MHDQLAEDWHYLLAVMSCEWAWRWKVDGLDFSTSSSRRRQGRLVGSKYSLARPHSIAHIRIAHGRWPFARQPVAHQSHISSDLAVSTDLDPVTQRDLIGWRRMLHPSLPESKLIGPGHPCISSFAARARARASKGPLIHSA